MTEQERRAHEEEIAKRIRQLPRAGKDVTEADAALYASVYLDNLQADLEAMGVDPSPILAGLHAQLVQP